MRSIRSALKTDSAEFRENAAHNRALAGVLRERQRAARHVRPQRDLDRLARQGKLFLRDRLALLLDTGAPFLELSTLAANDKDRTPLVFLQNITGFMVGRDYERQGITKDGAKMIMAVAGASVPKFTVNANASFGAGTYGMAGRAFDSRFLFSWPQAQVAVMGAEQAAVVLSEVKIRQLAREGRALSEDETQAIRAPVIRDYEAQSSAWHATSELWDDGILDPVDTRNALGLCISAALNAPIRETPHYGVFRM